MGVCTRHTCETLGDSGQMTVQGSWAMCGNFWQVSACTSHLPPELKLNRMDGQWQP